MRIAITSDLISGDWTGCEELWASLAGSALRAGHKVAFFCYRDNLSAAKIQPLVDSGMELFRNAAGGRMVGRIRRTLSWKLASLVEPLFPPFAGLGRFAPDVVFISGSDALPRAIFLEHLQRSGALKLPYVVVCHNSHLFEPPQEQSFRDAVARYYQGARLVLFTARRTKVETEHLLATALPQARFVKNPVNMTDTSAVPMPVDSTVRVASVGRILVNSKGQDTLIAALGSPEFRPRDWRLSLYGTGPHTGYLQQLAKHHGIVGKVDFRGQARDIRQIWAENHILALPSRVESSPLVLVEAMLCGRPSVVNDVGGVLEWAGEPETAFVSPGIHVDSFGAALERAWSARAEWESMGRRAREKALQQIDPDPGGTVLKILMEAHAGRG